MIQTISEQYVLSNGWSIDLLEEGEFLHDREIDVKDGKNATIKGVWEVNRNFYDSLGLELPNDFKLVDKDLDEDEAFYQFNAELDIVLEDEVSDPDLFLTSKWSDWYIEAI